MHQRKVPAPALTAPQLVGRLRAELGHRRAPVGARGQRRAEDRGI